MSMLLYVYLPLILFMYVVCEAKISRIIVFN